MQSFFELKTALPFDEAVFIGMKNKALDVLAGNEAHQYAQAIVVQTENGVMEAQYVKNALHDDHTDEIALIDRLSGEGTASPTRVLCMWQDGGIDLPSMTFRKMLSEQISDLSKVGIFVTTKEGVSVIPFSVTMS